MKQVLLKTWLMLVCLLVGVGTTWAETYSFTIQASDFNTTSYAANNGSHDFTATCTTDGSKTMTVACTSNQVMKNSNNMQWQKSSGYIYNTTDLGTIKSVTVNSSAGTFTTNYGTTEHPTSGTTVGNGYFTVKVGSATGTTSSIVVTFEISDGGGDTPQKTTPALSFANATYNATMGEPFVAPTLTNEQGVTVSYSSSETGVATVNASTGAISLVAPGTTKITASFAGNETYNATSANYNLVVSPAPFASLEELVAADLTTGTEVTVSFENVPIKSFQTVSSARKGVYFDIQKGGNDIEIYFTSEVPAEWAVGGTLSGTLTNCPWKLYSSTWELAPASGWAWTNLTYNAPAQKTITALAVSGTPTKTTYLEGDEFETAGLVVTATYDDESQEVISTGFDWEIDYGKTGEVNNAALVAGATSVDVMVYTNEVMSEVYTVTGLTVTVPVTLTSIVVSGTPTKTEYYAGDAFETAGLVVTGTYSDSHQETITEGIEWTVDPETLTLGTTSVDVMASVGNVDSEVYTVNDLTVAENPIKVAIKNGFSSGDNNGSHKFTDNTDISFEAFQGNAGTAPAINSSNLRLYQGGGYVTITGAAGVTISQIKITTSATYESTTVGYCVDDEDAPTTGESVAKSSDYTITNLNNQSVSIYCLGTDNKARLEIAAIEVKYTKEDIELSSIALSGEYQTEFIQNQTFNHDGIVVTANFSNDQNEDVTAKAEFTNPDMTTTGTKTITVSYTDADVTKTADYEITVVAEVVTAIALSGDYQTTFRAGDTFNHDNLEVKATYNSGRTNIDVTSEATVSTPDMSVAGEQNVTVSYGGQNANYTIKVIPANVIFYESFDTNNGTGGNDDQWNGSIAANNISSDNANWTFAYSGGANKCAKFGTGSSKGSATTPALGHEGTAIMTFKSAAWNGGSESLVVNLSVEGDGAISQSSITNTKGKWTTYTVTLTGLTAESKVKFEAANASNNRFFLDEVLIVEANELTLVATDGENYYATFSSTEDVEFVDAEVYTITVENDVLSLNEVASKQVPAGNGVLIKSDNTKAIYTNVDNAATLAANMLRPASVTKETDGSYLFYKLAYGGWPEQTKLGFWWGEDNGAPFESKAGGVYLAVPVSVAPSNMRGFSFNESSNPTGIETVKTTNDNVIFNLQGQRINRVQKGVNIVNGKKVIR